MAGLEIFRSLADALRAGYQVYDRTTDGYLVRTRTASGWEIAMVCIPKPQIADPDVEC